MQTEAKLVFHSEGGKEIEPHQAGHNLHLYQSQAPHRIVKQFHRTWIRGRRVCYRHSEDHLMLVRIKCLLGQAFAD